MSPRASYILHIFPSFVYAFIYPPPSPSLLFLLASLVLLPLEAFIPPLHLQHHLRYIDL